MCMLVYTARTYTTLLYRMHMRRGTYSHVSFTIEPIQLPSVPLKSFVPNPLRKHTHARKARRSGRTGWSAASTGGIQSIEAREHAQLHWQRACQLVRVHSAARKPIAVIARYGMLYG